MQIFDVILVVLWSAFVFYGFFYGSIRLVGNFVGLLVGVFLASRLYLEFYESFEYLFGSYEGVGKIVSFLFLYGVISKLVSFGFSMLEGVFNLISIIPFLKSFNKLGGAILGFLLGGVVIGLILYLSSRHFLLGSLIGKYLVDSQITPILIYFAKLVQPLLPEAIKAMKSLL